MHVVKVAVIGIVALAVAAPALAQETRADRRQERRNSGSTRASSPAR
jgi:hypothetical protein